MKKREIIVQASIAILEEEILKEEKKEKPRIDYQLGLYFSVGLLKGILAENR